MFGFACFKELRSKLYVQRTHRNSALGESSSALLSAALAMLVGETSTVQAGISLPDPGENCRERRWWQLHPAKGG